MHNSPELREAILIRTSQSHPIQLGLAKIPNDQHFSVGLTFCPGKIQSHSMTGAWRRNLVTDLQRLKDIYKVNRLVCCLEEHELAQLQVELLPNMVGDYGIQWIHIPIADGSVPKGRSIDHLMQLSKVVAQSSTENELTAVFCKGGLGRTGLVSACILQQKGLSAEDSIRVVRTARPGAIENARQEDYVIRFLANQE